MPGKSVSVVRQLLAGTGTHTPPAGPLMRIRPPLDLAATRPGAILLSIEDTLTTPLWRDPRTGLLAAPTDAERTAWTSDIRLFTGYDERDARPPTARAVEVARAVCEERGLTDRAVAVSAIVLGLHGTPRSVVRARGARRPERMAQERSVA